MKIKQILIILTLSITAISCGGVSKNNPEDGIQTLNESGISYRLDSDGFFTDSMNLLSLKGDATLYWDKGVLDSMTIQKEGVSVEVFVEIPESDKPINLTQYYRTKGDSSTFQLFTDAQIEFFENKMNVIDSISDWNQNSKVEVLNIPRGAYHFFLTCTKLKFGSSKQEIYFSYHEEQDTVYFSFNFPMAGKNTTKVLKYPILR
jgi:hypothetical protein